MTSYWHPFADGAAVEATGELSIVRAEGSHIWDADGRRYLDATASLWYCNVGHGRPEIGAAVAEQMRELESYSTFQDLTNPAVSALADRVAAIAPMADAEGVPDERRVRFDRHGDQDGAALLAARRAAGAHDPASARTRLPRDACRRARRWPGSRRTRRATDRCCPMSRRWRGTTPTRCARRSSELGADRVAAFFCEPVIGAGGVYAPPPGYLEQARAVCRETGVLFVADEVITGFGRTGEWFASTRWGLDPDLVTCAKGITSGYLPLGAVLVAPSVWGPFFAEGAGMFRHGYTYSGHAAVAAAALANLDSW